MSANVATQRRTNGGFTLNSASYVDLLDAAAGNTVAATITKGAGTDLIVIGGTQGQNTTASDTIILGVNDGTSDFDMGRIRTFTSANHLTCTGARQLTGLGAGATTVKLRVRNVAGSNMSFSSGGSYITVIECNAGALVAAATTVVPAGNFTWTSTTYTDLLNNAGGSTIAVTLTKASGAGTNLVVRGSLSMLGSASADTVTLGVHDGTTTHDLCESRGTNSPHRQCVGEIAITGLAAGSYTLKLRVKCATGNTQTFGSVNSASLVVMEINA